jgi:hypothetical protein
MHDVFPVSLLEPWTDRPGVEDTMPLPDLLDEEEEWEVEDIVDHIGHGAATRYLVKWTGWPVEYNTWEPEEHLANSPNILRRYQRRKSRKAHRKWDEA